VEEDAGVGDGGAAGGVGCHGAECGEGLRGAADEEQGAHAAFGGDGAAGQDLEAGSCGEGGDGDEADVGVTAGETGGACGGGHTVDLVAQGERGIQGRVFEVPHERRGIEKVDGGDAQAGVRGGGHLCLRLASLR